MAISRRALGLGLLGASAAATGAVVYGGSNPAIRGLLGETTTLFGFVGGEKEGLVADEGVVAALRRHALALDARRAGSVEMVRERALLDQNPGFLWPSAGVFVDLAHQSGVAVRRDQVVLNSPIVAYSWDSIAKGLARAGLAQAEGETRYRVDLKALLDAVLADRSWASLGVPDLYGAVRVISTDPNRSNSGFMFAGLAANLMAGTVATLPSLDAVGPRVAALFARMGYKPSSSGKMFEDYVAGGPGAQPLIVGYENQLVEWVLADEDRWRRLEAAAPAKPVVLYPQPTVFSAHPVIAIRPEADALIEALTSPEVQEIAWTRHGFRGPLGTSGELQNPLVRDRVLPRIDAVLPLPDIRTMLALLDRVAA